MGDRTCSSGCPGPEPGARVVPLWAYVFWRAWDTVTWPATVRELKRAGFHKTGFMTWETGPAEEGTDG